jgi:hypothetical protein
MRGLCGLGSPVKFVASANVMRRHLTAGERADAATAIANMKHGGSHKEQDAPVHLAEAADMFGVSERLVADAKAEAGPTRPAILPSAPHSGTAARCPAGRRLATELPSQEGSSVLPQTTPVNRDRSVIGRMQSGLLMCAPALPRRCAAAAGQ